MKEEKEKEKQNVGPLAQKFEPLIPTAVLVIRESVEGKAVNPERLKSAKFVVNTLKSSEIIEKEKRKVSLNEKKFNLNVLENFGTPEQKEEVKKVIQKSLSGMKYLE